MEKKITKKKKIFSDALTSSATHTADPGILTLESKRPGYFVLNQFFTLFFYLSVLDFMPHLSAKKKQRIKKKRRLPGTVAGTTKEKKSQLKREMHA